MDAAQNGNVKWYRHGADMTSPNPHRMSSAGAFARMEVATTDGHLTHTPRKLERRWVGPEAGITYACGGFHR